MSPGGNAGSSGNSASSRLHAAQVDCRRGERHEEALALELRRDEPVPFIRIEQHRGLDLLRPVVGERGDRRPGAEADQPDPRMPGIEQQDQGSASETDGCERDHPEHQPAPDQRLVPVHEVGRDQAFPQKEELQIVRYQQALDQEEGRDRRAAEEQQDRREAGRGEKLGILGQGIVIDTVGQIDRHLQDGGRGGDQQYRQQVMRRRASQPLIERAQSRQERQYHAPTGAAREGAPKHDLIVRLRWD